MASPVTCESRLPPRLVPSRLQVRLRCRAYPKDAARGGSSDAEMLFRGDRARKHFELATAQSRLKVGAQHALSRPSYGTETRRVLTKELVRSFLQ